MLFDKLIKTKNKIILHIKRKLNSPDSFMFISKDNKGNYIIPKGYSKIKEVGGIQDVTHMTFYDRMPHAVLCKMTDLKYSEKQDANAVFIDQKKFKRLDDCTGTTYFQPLKISK